MVAFVNRLSGGLMYVHETRVEEYLAAGHSLAAPPQPSHPFIPPDDQPRAEAKAAAKPKKRK